ncbi:hypothetical protein G7Z17_g2245 [Cylindrodendrum hubeiense]|uniref:CTP synthase n=1 Tax=Cylindrodendrum hubeiense TaxID=595255 RepID=A0A9P5HI24_9HYPO|nr:hypothetical protein G7Z17_g2245 [Cylindrodendrum hubeiense]
MRYILVSGGVISGVGKGIIASSTGLLLQTLGFRVSMLKIDPYVSVDAGLMSPAEHGECFVLASGGEADLDLGNYERYLSLQMERDNNITTGKIYLDVISKERKGAYLGRTVQIVPHVVDGIKDWIKRVACISIDGSGETPDVCIIELGGTVGDIESMPFIEALTQLRHEVGSSKFVNIMVSYVPTVHGEQKTKPTQHAVKAIRSSGLIPDVVEVEQIIVVRDMPTIYQVPLLLNEQKLVPLLLSKLVLETHLVPQPLVAKGAELWKSWKSIATAKNDETVNIALVGKYVDTPDAYMSVTKALEHSAMRVGRNLNLMWIDSEHLENEMQTASPVKFHKAWHQLNTASGLIVPGGFGNRGVKGMMLATKWARENGTPFLGVCLGFQAAVMQFARDICSIPEAYSEEFGATGKDAVVVHMPELDRENMGGTMRLGRHKTLFQEGSEWTKIRALYNGAEVIEERHRHRYEVNPEMVETLQNAGMAFVGKDTTSTRMEILELKDHPFFVGTQFHAEYQSRVLEPSKPYLGFIAASAGCLDEVLKKEAAKGSA